MKTLKEGEEARFLGDHPKSGVLYQRAQSSLLGGVPMADFELERFLHLYALNRGVLLTPFHNMALMSPATTESDIDAHTKIFAAATAELTS